MTMSMLPERNEAVNAAAVLAEVREVDVRALRESDEAVLRDALTRSVDIFVREKHALSFYLRRAVEYDEEKRAEAIDILARELARMLRAGAADPNVCGKCLVPPADHFDCPVCGRCSAGCTWAMCYGFEGMEDE